MSIFEYEFNIKIVVSIETGFKIDKIIYIFNVMTINRDVVTLTVCLMTRNISAAFPSQINPYSLLSYREWRKSKSLAVVSADGISIITTAGYRGLSSIKLND